MRKKELSLLMLVVAFNICIGWAGNTGTLASLPAFDFLNTKISSWIDSNYFDGIVVKVFRGNHPIFEYSKNYTDTSTVSSSSTERWFATATIATIVDRGKLSWDDKVEKYLPQITGVKREITLRQLLANTETSPWESTKIYSLYITLKEAIEKITAQTSNASDRKKSTEEIPRIVLAERMAEIVTGKKWEDLFQKEIANPLRIRHTSFKSDGEFKTCARDYDKFLKMISSNGMFNGKKILSEASIREMESSQENSRSDASEYIINTRQSNSTNVYGLGVFREEVGRDGKPSLIGCPDKEGTYSWIDRKNGVYGFMIAKANGKILSEGFSPALFAPLLPLITRDAFSEEKYPKELKYGKVDIGDAQIYYEEMGKGEPLILIHGHTLTHRMWDNQFFEFSRYFRVIRYDLRSYGYSSPQDGKTKFAHVDDLIRFMDKLGIKKAHIVGLSLGGMIGADMLGLYPERIKTAVLASGNVRFNRRISVPMTSAESARRDSEIQSLKQKGVDVMKRKWFADLMESGGSNREMMRSPLWSMVYQWDAWHALHKEIRSIYGEDAFDKLKLKRPTNPVLILEGQSKNNKYDLRPQILNYLPKGKQLVIPDCGHMLNMERPVEFNRVVLNFIRSSN